MAVKIRLARHGTKHKPYYRVVIADSEEPRNGSYIEHIGSYDPKNNKQGFSIEKDRLEYWLSKGAKPTDTVASLIKNNKQ